MKNKEIQAKALKFLARREYAYLELLQKLKGYFPDDETAIVAVLDNLKQRGWLSDERYINSYITSKANRYGPNKIIHQLKAKVGNAEQVTEVFKSRHIDELKVAYQIWQRRFGDVTPGDKEKMRQVRFLHSRGFTFDVIKKIVFNGWAPEK